VSRWCIALASPGTIGIGELLPPDLVAMLNIDPSYWVVAIQYRGSEEQRSKIQAEQNKKANKHAPDFYVSGRSESKSGADGGFTMILTRHYLCSERRSSGNSRTVVTSSNEAAAAVRV
jgi:hypothetical protein